MAAALLERILEPRSGLGTGWRSRMSCDVPLMFHALPENVRIRAVAGHLGPALRARIRCTAVESPILGTRFASSAPATPPRGRRVTSPRPDALRHR